MQFGMMDYGYGAMGFGMWILFLIFWLLGIAGLVLLFKHFWECRTAMRVNESALELLKKRYAKGEISKEEFEEKQKEM